MKEKVLIFFCDIWEFYINKFKIPYLEFVFIFYFSLHLFNFVAIPEKDSLRQYMSYLSRVIGLIILLDCIKCWCRYIEINDRKTDTKEVLKKYFNEIFKILLYKLLRVQ
ncbi:hypothetical protein CINTURNW_2279 [Clostridium intestinale URNW]|uniref:Uncharacterized protein n=1 Tax=Clostridium intestinale URNW TaxID=1294142 RepID=U2NQ78_9CLOT|nr:hypothetical protein CINTURNW_2279 [Clostridium intestinale URNW]